MLLSLTRREKPILAVNLLYIPIFTVIALAHLNFEFLLYVGVVLVVFGLILWNQHRIRFDSTILWGLTVWGFLHLSGGNINIGSSVLYDKILIPLLPAYNILRYDQVVHLFGFGVATLVCHHLIKPYLRDDVKERFVLSFLIVLMGSGLGALNEIVEFVAVETVPETHVGGYTNTLLDLIFNLIGAILAVLLLAIRRTRQRPIARS